MTLINIYPELPINRLERLNFKNNKEKIINLLSLDKEYVFFSKTHFVKNKGPIYCSPDLSSCCRNYGVPQHFINMPVIEYKNYNQNETEIAFYGYLALSFKSFENIQNLNKFEDKEITLKDLCNYDLKVTEKEILSASSGKTFKSLKFQIIEKARIHTSIEHNDKFSQFLQIYKSKIQWSIAKTIDNESEFKKFIGLTPVENETLIDIGFDEIPFD